MTSAVDSSIVLDVVTGDSTFAIESARQLREARRAGRLIVCEAVIAEITPALESEDLVRELLDSWGLLFVPSTLDLALQAGINFRRYLTRGGAQRRVVADFLIGAYAMNLADQLVARDRGYLRDYFSGLTVVDPSAG